MRPTLIALARSFCARIQVKTYPISSIRRLSASCRAGAASGSDTTLRPRGCASTRTLKEGRAALMARGDFTRWLYRGQRPNWIARILNRASAAVGSSGVAPNYLVTLEVTGRKSGRTFSLPLVVAVVGGQQYLVSMLGDNVRWVQNVRAAGGKAVLRHGRREEICLEEVPAGQRAPILKAYLQTAPGARPHVPVNKDAALSEFEKIAAAIPVFRVLSAG